MTERVTTSGGSRPDPGAALLQVRGLGVTYRQRRRIMTAVSGVSFDVGPGQTVGLVGESGSGKSTIVKAVLGLVEPSEGQVSFQGRDITRLGTAERLGGDIRLQAVFQDPKGSLDPRRTIGWSVAEPLRAGSRPPEKARRRELVGEALERVGLPAETAERYPASLSGGQLQRIAIARALMTSPRLVTCDESVSALDLSVQAQILNLLQRLQDEEGLSYLFVSHDLRVVRHLCHQVVVLYQGRVMESGPAAEVIANPSHPYTRALLDAAPLLDPTRQRARRGSAHTWEARPGAPAGRSGAQRGCPFAGRCAYVRDICHVDEPALRSSDGTVKVACHRYPEWLADAPH